MTAIEALAAQVKALTDTVNVSIGKSEATENYNHALLQRIDKNTENIFHLQKDCTEAIGLAKQALEEIKGVDCKIEKHMDKHTTMAMFILGGSGIMAFFSDKARDLYHWLFK